MFLVGYHNNVNLFCLSQQQRAPDVCGRSLHPGAGRNKYFDFGPEFRLM